MTSSTTTTGTKTGRARRRFGQLWQVPTFLLGLLAFIGVAASAPWRQNPHALAFEEQLKVLRVGLEQDTDVDKLVTYAEAALLKLPTFRWRVAEVHFLAGSAYYRQAREKPPPLAKTIWPRAIEFLDKALAHNPPEPDRPMLQYRLGYSLYQMNKDLPRAVDLMTQTVERGADDQLEGYRALADANLRLVKPNLEGALFASRRVIDLTPENSSEGLAEARVKYAELLIRAEQRTEAIKMLELISMRTPRPLRIKARLLQAEACKKEELWMSAASIWQELVADANHIKGDRAYINYELGWCFHQMKPHNYDASISHWSDALRAGGPAGQAAGLRLGELKLTMDPKRAESAIDDWKKALDQINRPEDFRNPYIEVAQVAELFVQAIEILEGRQDAEKTQAVAELLRRVTKGGGADERIGKASEARAKALEARRKIDKSSVSAEQVQEQYRRAGEAFENAAKVSTNSERADLQWRSIKCYLEAKDNTTALRLLLEYKDLETREAALAAGWFTLGDLYLIEGKKDDAHKSLVKCLQYPDTSFAYRARYLLAVMEIEKKNYPQAKEELKHILDGNPNIDPPAHEKALYRMGSLLMTMEKFGEAHVYLKNSVHFYPENPNANLTRQQLGDCYRRLAAKELVKIAELNGLIKPDMPEERKQQLRESMTHHRGVRKKYLKDAALSYEQLRDLLETKFREQPLDKLNQMLLGRARFGIGDCHLDAEEFEAAFATYREVQVKHRKTLESFFACSRICYTVSLMRPASASEGVKYKEQAMESLRNLLEDLREMPDNHEIFRQAGVMTRPGWIRFAETKQQELLSPPKKQAQPGFP